MVARIIYAVNTTLNITLYRLKCQTFIYFVFLFESLFTLGLNCNNRTINCNNNNYTNDDDDNNNNDNNNNNNHNNKDNNDNAFQIDNISSIYASLTYGPKDSVLTVCNI